MRLQDTDEYLDFLLSPRSLRLHEEYESRINVLKKLKYIDEENLGEGFKILLSDFLKESTKFLEKLILCLISWYYSPVKGSRRL